MNFRLSDLSVWGWLLVLATIGVIVLLMIPWGEWISNLLPEGDYPAIILALPVLVIAIIFFSAGAFALKLIGLSVVRKPRQESNAGEGNDRG